MLKLENKDIEITNAYIHNYGGAIMQITPEQFLAPWYRNKKLLYKLLGNQLTYTWDLDEKDAKETAISEINSTMLYSIFASPFSNLRDVAVKIYCKVHEIPEWEYPSNYNFNVTAEEIFNNRLEGDYTIVIGDKKFEFHKNERVVKDFQKLCNYIEANYLDEAMSCDFGPNRMAQDIDRITKVIELGKKKKSITLSIHPMDYLTMSDNEEKWNSCMSLKNRGCYCNGAYEMMTSPNVIIAYTKSSRNKMTVRKDEMWNSKTWRSLFIVDRRFILAGKAYPKISNSLSGAVMAKLVELAGKNLNWNDFEEADKKYKYYNDSNKIKIISHDMYNDYSANDGMNFLIRYSKKFNPNKRIIVNYSGPIYCLGCGKRININTKIGENDYVCNDCNNSYKDKKIVCAACNRPMRIGTQVRYLDNDKDFERPIHTSCYDESIHTTILTEEQYFVNPDDCAIILFSRPGLWRDAEYIIHESDLVKLQQLRQWSEFSEASKKQSFIDGKIYRTYSYNGLIEDYFRFKQFITETIKGAA